MLSVERNGLRRNAKTACRAVYARDPVGGYDDDLTSIVITTPMVHEFGLDLKVARRRSALTQTDCAHFLGVDPSRISKLESGKSTPTVVELSILYLIFNRSFGSVSHEIVASLSKSLRERLASIPDCPESWPDRGNRLKTLAVIGEKLAAIDADL